MTAVIVLLIIGLSATIFVLMLSVQADDDAALRVSGERSRWMAVACAEHGLSQARFTAGYTGSESLSFGEDRCTVGPLTVISSSSYELAAEGWSGEAVSRFLVEFELSTDASGSPDAVPVATKSQVIDF